VLSNLAVGAPGRRTEDPAQGDSRLPTWRASHPVRGVTAPPLSPPAWLGSTWSAPNM
jgi:hypothetical protein